MSIVDTTRKLKGRQYVCITIVYIHSAIFAKDAHHAGMPFQRPNRWKHLEKAVRLNLTKREGSMAADGLTAEIAAPHQLVFAGPRVPLTALETKHLPHLLTLTEEEPFEEQKRAVSLLADVSIL